MQTAAATADDGTVRARIIPYLGKNGIARRREQCVAFRVLDYMYEALTGYIRKHTSTTT